VLSRHKLLFYVYDAITLKNDWLLVLFRGRRLTRHRPSGGCRCVVQFTNHFLITQNSVNKMARITLLSIVSTCMLLAFTPTTSSLRPFNKRSPIPVNASPLSTLGLNRRGWATTSVLGLTTAVGLPRSAAAFAKDAEKGALTSLERQVELKRRPLPLLTRKKLEQVRHFTLGTNKSLHLLGTAVALLLSHI